MKAGGRSDSAAALDGVSVAASVAPSLRSRLGTYHVRNVSMALRSSRGASAFSVKEGSDRSVVIHGYHSNWKTSGGSALSELSRASCAITAEMLPPAESPATAIRLGSPPNSAACSPTQHSAAQLSLMPAGKGCSGASR